MQVPRSFQSLAPSENGHEKSFTGWRLTEDLWQMQYEIESQVERVDRLLRQAWLWLGGVILPCAGTLLYVLGQQLH